MIPRVPVVQPRLFKVGRTGKLGRQPPPARGTAVLSADVDTSKLSHVARRRIASPPMAKIERAVDAVGSALQAWADRFIAAVMREVVRPVVQDEHGHSIGLIEDVSVDQVYASLDDPKVAKATLESTFRAVDKASSDDLRVMGVRTGSVVPNADRLQSAWIEKNTALIKAQRDVVSRVRKVIEEAVPQGKSVADIRKLLEEQAGYARSRAELTARDQTLKLYGQIQQERQQSAGFTHYVWTTSLDERVREEHAELDGKVIAWDDPPVVDKRTGRRAHAGMDFQCRCSAVPYTGDDVGEAEAPTQDLPDVPFEVRLPEPPAPVAPDLEALAAQQAAKRQAELARLQQEAELARVEAERLAAAKAKPLRVEEFIFDPGIPDAVKQEFFPLSQAQYRKLHSGGIFDEPDSVKMLQRFVSSDYPAIRALQQGASIDDILKDEKTFGFYKRSDLETLAKRMPALRHAQEVMSVENPTRLGPLYRGVNVPKAVLDEWLEADQIEFRAFSNSSTYEFDKAKDFATLRGDPGRIVLRWEHLDRGAPVGFSSNPNNVELEVIVSDGKFDITKITYDRLQDLYIFDLKRAAKADEADGKTERPDFSRDTSRFGSDGSDIRVIKRAR